MGRGCWGSERGDEFPARASAGVRPCRGRARCIVRAKRSARCYGGEEVDQVARARYFTWFSALRAIDRFQQESERLDQIGAFNEFLQPPGKEDIGFAFQFFF